MHYECTVLFLSFKIYIRVKISIKKISKLYLNSGGRMLCVCPPPDTHSFGKIYSSVDVASKYQNDNRVFRELLDRTNETMNDVRKANYYVPWNTSRLRCRDKSPIVIVSRKILILTHCSWILFILKTVKYTRPMINVSGAL